MRVAMGLCLNEDNPTERAIQAYVDVYSTFNYMSHLHQPYLIHVHYIRKCQVAI